MPVGSVPVCRPGVMGKSGDDVVPVTKTLPALSTAIPNAESEAEPPKVRTYRYRAPVESNFTTVAEVCEVAVLIGVDPAR